MATLLAATGTVAAHLPRRRSQEVLRLPCFTLRLSRPLQAVAYPLVIPLPSLLAGEMVRSWVVERHQKRGHQLPAEQDFNGAEEAFRKAIGWEPGNAEHHFTLGGLYQARAEAEAADPQLAAGGSPKGQGVGSPAWPFPRGSRPCG